MVSITSSVSSAFSRVVSMHNYMYNVSNTTDSSIDCCMDTSTTTVVPFEIRVHFSLDRLPLIPISGLENYNK